MHGGEACWVPQVHKRYSDFIALDARLRAKYGNRKLDALLAKSRLPGAPQ